MSETRSNIDPDAIRAYTTAVEARTSGLEAAEEIDIESDIAHGGLQVFIRASKDFDPEAETSRDSVYMTLKSLDEESMLSIAPDSATGTWFVGLVREKSEDNWSNAERVGLSAIQFALDLVAYSNPNRQADSGLQLRLAIYSYLFEELLKKGPEYAENFPLHENTVLDQTFTTERLRDLLEDSAVPHIVNTERNFIPIAVDEDDAEIRFRSRLEREVDAEGVRYERAEHEVLILTTHPTDTDKYRAGDIERRSLRVATDRHPEIHTVTIPPKSDKAQKAVARSKDLIRFAAKANSAKKIDPPTA